MIAWSNVSLVWGGLLPSLKDFGRGILSTRSVQSDKVAPEESKATHVTKKLSIPERNLLRGEPICLWLSVPEAEQAGCWSYGHEHCGVVHPKAGRRPLRGLLDPFEQHGVIATDQIARIIRHTQDCPVSTHEQVHQCRKHRHHHGQSCVLLDLNFDEALIKPFLHFGGERWVIWLRKLSGGFQPTISQLNRATHHAINPIQARRHTNRQNRNQSNQVFAIFPRWHAVAIQNRAKHWSSGTFNRREGVFDLSCSDVVGNSSEIDHVQITFYCSIDRSSAPTARRLFVQNLQLTIYRAVAGPRGQKHLGQPMVLPRDTHVQSVVQEAA